MKDFRAVLLDLDDTLICRRRMFAGFSESFVRRFFAGEDAAGQARALKALRELDHDGDAARPGLFFRLFGRLNVELPPVREMLDYWNTVFPQYLAPIDGMFELLGRLRRQGYRLGLVTNGVPALQNSKIDRAGIRSEFDAVLVSGELPFEKPERAIFDLALGRLGTAAAEAVFVGDNLINDIYGAQQAGMRAFWANYYRKANRTAVRPDGEFSDAAGLWNLIGGAAG